MNDVTTVDKSAGASANTLAQPTEIEVGLLTGGGDKPYAYGLAMALASRGVGIDFIGSDELDSPELRRLPNLRFLNLRGSQRQEATPPSKVKRILVYYARLIRYGFAAKPKIFHILWNNKFQTIDRTFLMLYYKLQRRKIVLTAHNINAGKRDSNDSLFNRLTLRVQYRLADHIFVHTEKMRVELLQDFGVRSQAITVIPFGINNAVPQTDLTPKQAKERLGIKENEKSILFFGRIAPYKGLHFLVPAFQRISARDPGYRLIIAGQPKEGSEKYLDDVMRALKSDIGLGRVIQKIEFIPDELTEVYFKAADVLALPYAQIFQSGVLFLAYSFGLPAIATDVGSFSEDISEGRTGFVCKSCDPVDLAEAIEKYFESDLYQTLNNRRQEIRDSAEARYSWNVICEKTCKVYAQLLGR